MTDKFQRHVQAARARAQAGFVPAEPLIAALEVLAAERAARFRAQDDMLRPRIGYIGMDGFHTEEKPAPRFEGPVEGFTTRRSVSHWGMVG